MENRKTTIFKPMIFAFVAIMAWVAFNQIEPDRQRPDRVALQYGLAAVTILCGCAAGATGILWSIARYTDSVRDMDLAKHAAALQLKREERQTVEAYRNLDAAQVEAYIHGKVEIEIVVGDGEPEAWVTMPGARMRWEFLREFVGMCDEKYLARVSSWSEGTPRRMWAEAITRQLIRRRYATEAAGPYPAAWAPGMQEIGLQMIGYRRVTEKVEEVEE